MRTALLFVFILPQLWAQTGSLSGTVTHNKEPLEFINVVIANTTIGTTTNEAGKFIIHHVPAGKQTIKISGIGYQLQTRSIIIADGQTATIEIDLFEDVSQLQEVVVTGTMKEITKMNSPIPIEVYAPSFFKKNPTANIFESLNIVNGVQPQIN